MANQSTNPSTAFDYIRDYILHFGLEVFRDCWGPDSTVFKKLSQSASYKDNSANVDAYIKEPLLERNGLRQLKKVIIKSRVGKKDPVKIAKFVSCIKDDKDRYLAIILPFAALGEKGVKLDDFFDYELEEYENIEEIERQKDSPGDEELDLQKAKPRTDKFHVEFIIPCLGKVVNDLIFQLYPRMNNMDDLDDMDKVIQGYPKGWTARKVDEPKVVIQDFLRHIIGSDLMSLLEQYPELDDQLGAILPREKSRSSYLFAGISSSVEKSPEDQSEATSDAEPDNSNDFPQAEILDTVEKFPGFPLSFKIVMPSNTRSEFADKRPQMFCVCSECRTWWKYKHGGNELQGEINESTTESVGMRSEDNESSLHSMLSTLGFF